MAHPGSSRKKLEVRDGGVHLYTTAKPVDGRANSEAREILADYFAVPKSRVILYRGQKSKYKVFEISFDRDRLQSSPVLKKQMAQYLKEV
jgi:uncharacterized protein YggU (UPF0235/DUF167 family)